MYYLTWLFSRLQFSEVDQLNKIYLPAYLLLKYSVLHNAVIFHFVQFLKLQCLPNVTSFKSKLNWEVHRSYAILFVLLTITSLIMK